MKFIVIIPSRYGSTRLPAKALAEIEGEPLIAHVVKQANKSGASKVIVATDDMRIQAALGASACEVVMTSSTHESGSDRLAEVVEKMKFDDEEIIVNVQGDEPLIPPELIDAVAAALKTNISAQMSTAAKRLSEHSELNNPNTVKVVLNQSSEALYFSRSAIPYFQNNHGPANVLHHIGIYAYRVGFLKQFTAMQATTLEKTESLEQLRALENGAIISVHVTEDDSGIGVDTPEDLEKVRELIKANSN